MIRTIYRDKDKCIGCAACIVGCKNEHELPPYPTSPPELQPTGPSFITIYHRRPEIYEDRVEQYFLAISCMHCIDAPCIRACPKNAIFRDETIGAVMVDRNKCIGCRFCLWFCPYGAPRFDNEGKMVKCDLCIDRIKEGKKPMCEQTCPACAVIISTPEEIAEAKGRHIMEQIGTPGSLI
jgi:anaerobic dimethyl sulfoxide reductase subunit B